MRRRDLEKLRKLDPKVAAQLERALAEREAAQTGETTAPSFGGDEEARTRARGPEGSCEPRGVEARSPHPPTSCAAVAAPCGSRGANEEPGGPEREPETAQETRERPGPTRASAGPREAEGACEAPGEAASRRPTPFISAEAQAGLPEVPQTLVSTEASPAEQLAELWAGYPDEEVPGAELERRTAEAKAKREAERVQDAAHSAQLGFFPSAWWRRRGTGSHVRCDQLELQLDGIEKRRGRHSLWDAERSALRTMENVEAQCFTVRELGDRSASLPEFLRGQHPTLTRTQLDVLRAVITAYMGGALGVYEYEAILASDLGLSERAFRYALNGGKNRPPGLVELGLVRRRQTWLQRGGLWRPSDHHYLLLQVGPALGEQLLPWACTQLARLGRRVPRRSGYTRRTAARRAVELRQQARTERRETAERAVRRKLQGAEVEPVRARRSPPKISKLNCAAQSTVNPVPLPLTGRDGGLGGRRGVPLQIPPLSDSLREPTLAPPMAPPQKANGSDSQPLPRLLRDRAQALDGSAKLGPKELDVWRRRRDRGYRVPEHIDEAIFADRIERARRALVGLDPVRPSSKAGTF